MSRLRNLPPEHAAPERPPSDTPPLHPDEATGPFAGWHETEEAPAQGGIIEHAPPPGFAGFAEPDETSVAPPPPDEVSDESADTAEALQPLREERLRSVIESLLFVADRPLTVTRLCELLEATAAAPREPTGPPLYQPAQVHALLLQMEEESCSTGRGVELHQVAGGFQLRTAPENAPWVQRLLQAKPVRLSRAQLETLAIVAYRQPVTRPEIDDVRGVDSGGSLKTLLERQLIRVLGKKEEPGRPLLYGTTREFLEFFNLRDLKELPTLREYYDLTDEHKAKVQALGGEPQAVSPAEPGTTSVEAPAAASPGVAPGVPGALPPLGRVEQELIDQQLAYDATQLSQIDELIRSVRVDFKMPDPAAEMLAAISPAAAAAAAAPAAPAAIDFEEEEAAASDTPEDPGPAADPPEEL